MKKCFIRDQGKPKCKNEVITILKVLVQHPTCQRWQSWSICEVHLMQFLRKEGKGYYKWYSDGRTVPVIDYQEPILQLII